MPRGRASNIVVVNQRAGHDHATGASTFAWADHDGVLFDLDGVITPTAEIHERAWADTVRGPTTTPPPTTSRSIDGKPRYDGVRSFLASRGITLPDGDPDDPPGTDTVCALGNRKNALFNEILDREGIAPYPGRPRLLDLLERIGVPAAIVSSSKNATARPRGGRASATGSTSSSTAS